MAGKRVAPPEARWANEKKTKKAPKAASSKKGGAWLAALLAVVVVLAGGYCALCAYVSTSDTILPGITAGENVSLGGLTRAQAEEKLAGELPALLESTTRTLTLEGQTLGTWTMAEIGFTPNCSEMADAAWSVGRTGSFLTGGISYLRGLLGSECRSLFRCLSGRFCGLLGLLCRKRSLCGFLRLLGHIGHLFGGILRIPGGFLGLGRCILSGFNICLRAFSCVPLNQLAPNALRLVILINYQ